MTTRLYYAPRTRAFTALWLLEELGEPYELESFSIHTGRHKKDDYLALNPMGKVPLVVHDGVPVSETGAVALYLADRLGSDLAPKVDDAERSAFLRWMFFAGSVTEPALGEKFFKWDVPSSSVAWGSFADMERMLTAGITPGPWLLGERFSIADVVVGASARFGVMFGAFAKEGPIADYVARLSGRDAFKRAEVIEAREGERFPPKK
ncbi:MAG: glutathione S-transferase [Polyangiales bacterium]|jgi:glutathione S-transferase